ncbi:hypothetical protein C8Q77DRAFT_699971 [Trametes polyzona]|nr:hypothetical protein C8Q77DRAFT_699971 [Trametes polyzona]
MAKRRHEADAESSEDDTPETFSFGSSKKAAKGEQEAVRQFQAAQKLKQKEKNRAIDRKLKARAAEAQTTGKGKAKDAGASHWEKATRGKGAEEDASDDSDASDGGEGASARSALEERMARAMKEAEEEDSEDLDEEAEGSAFEGFSGEDADMGGSAEESEADEDMSEEDDELAGEDEEGEEYDEEDEDEDMTSEDDGEDEEEEEEETVEHPPPKSASQKRNYLPDHLFKSALSEASSRNTKITFDDDDSAPSHRARTSPPPKRRRAKRPAKDIVLGSKTIRTLPKTSEAITPAAAKGLPPPRRVNKFLKQSLNLKGDLSKAKTKGWTRRAANLGVMKRSGPAANFVRSS